MSVLNTASPSLSPDAGRPGPLPLRFNLRELGGGLGDIGVAVPVVAALVSLNGFSATSVLLVFGLAYMVTGLYYRLPVPVQPLKAMAAIVIARELGPDVVAAAGILMAGALLFLAVTGLIKPLARVFPVSVIRGIQLAVGLLLVISGVRLCLDGAVVYNGPDVTVAAAGLSVPAAALVAAAVAPVALLVVVRPRLPVLLLILPPAIVAGAMLAPGGASGVLTVGPQVPSFALPQASLLLTALVVLVIPQLPLTLGNAVIASADAARHYYGERARRVNYRSLLTSGGLANAFTALIGGFPLCHGSGGMTAHYRFGARTGGATMMVGGLLVVLALGFGSGAAGVLALIPLPVLGVLLAIVGVQHSLLARDTRPGFERWLAVLIGVVAVWTGNVAIGFATGIVVYGLRNAPGWVVGWRTRLSAPAGELEAETAAASSYR